MKGILLKPLYFLVLAEEIAAEELAVVFEVFGGGAQVLGFDLGD
jgi:hypothetical protein